MILQIISLLLLAFVQSISFSLVSRSRNRNNITYHIIASIFSNGVWFLTFRELILNDMNLLLFIPYTIGTVTGSVTGVKISQRIEKWLGAESDSHLNQNKNGKSNQN
jgi:hypothetical protein